MFVFCNTNSQVNKAQETAEEYYWTWWFYYYKSMLRRYVGFLSYDDINLYDSIEIQLDPHNNMVLVKNITNYKH